MGLCGFCADHYSVDEIAANLCVHPIAHTEAADLLFLHVDYAIDVDVDGDNK